MRHFLRQLLDALAHRGPGDDLPTRSETALRTAFTALADRYDEAADKTTDDAAAAHIRRTTRDIRTILRVDRLPLYLLTGAELAVTTPAHADEEATR
ncbi:hypothetical protein AAW14_06110 [Streptomyces hygroscopicus]|uniref:hypothetical protein n=1 Tax=Streptomyces hygroscopicus TaxID=1912 RepID=UPI00223FA2F6|nr:hypothetical protein [Streptomyces hygroscopicus]MCW7941620.1 hypothetical protein [Streptomyces hygroscopicus]